MFEQYVSEETILKEIMYYIDTDFYNYAVMIDGAWGSGKTYFVKHVLLKKIESNEKRVLYVSLYGISNIQELGKKLYLDFLFKDKSKLVTEHSELVENVIGTMIDIGAPFMGKLGDIDIKEKKIKNIVQNTVKHICPMKNCVLIFDDLERCDCSIQDILGYINGFVEQAEMKVIIIANQEELRKKVDAQTLAMQIRAVIGRDGYVNTLVYQTAFDEIESELEKFRCQIYKAKYVPVKASPISGMMRYFGEDSETKGTDE